MTDEISVKDLSPRARKILEDYAKTTGHDNITRVVEELAFSMLELQQIIDTQRDPLLEPEAARRQMETMRGILQRFKRFKE